MSRVTVESTEYLCFGSGGANGWVFVGILMALEREMERCGLTFKTQIKGASGASVGSIFALAVMLNYDAIELREMAKRCLEKYSDRLSQLNLAELRTRKGLIDTKVIGDAVSDFIEHKLGKDQRNITLGDLYKQTKKHLVIAAHNASYERGEILDYRSAPDLEVHKAIQMSCAIPVIFQIVAHNRCAYSDAAQSNSLPFEVFDMERTLAFNVMGRHEYASPEDMSAADYFCRISHTYEAITRTKIDHLPPHLQRRIMSLYVPCVVGNVVGNMILTDESRDMLINLGLTTGLGMFYYPTAIVSHAAIMYHNVTAGLRSHSTHL